MNLLKWTAILAVVISCYVLANDIEQARTVEQAFVDAEIVPDVIDTAPKSLLKVSFPSGAEVNLGNELTPTQVKDIPTVSWSACSEEYYALAFIDPDVPSRKEPTSREWHHWLVGNIPGDDVASGETLSAFIGSAPDLNTSLHRYVFITFKQPGILIYDELRLPNNSTDNRSNFSISSFARKYNLGNPVAGNFYLAQYDDYVPVVYQQIGA